MKKLVLLIILVTVFFSCGQNNQGELVGVQDRKDWYESKPHGMVFIPMGSYTMGPSDESASWAMTSKSKTVSVDAFWMDATEITNNEYRQFVKYVKDSIIRQRLIMSGADKYTTGPDTATAPNKNINWETEILETDLQAIRSELYLENRYYGQKSFDKRKLVYNYYWIDYQQAAKRSNKYKYNYEQGEGLPDGGNYEGTAYNYAQEKTQPVNSRGAFVQRAKTAVYPDTLVWIRDFTYSFNEPYADNYFSHPAYDDYPVVGVDWEQAFAFSIWRTRQLNSHLRSQGQGEVQDYRLPTEAEWEYAARGNLDKNPYPWGGPYTRNKEGCFLANFKPMRGNYVDDGALITNPVGSYAPNEYGLYDMAGNVAEWTVNAYDESSYSFSHDMNPNYQYRPKSDDPPAMKRKVIRGGSWKDIGFYLQNSARAYEYKDTAKSYIGFRCVRSYLGGSRN